MSTEIRTIRLKVDRAAKHFEELKAALGFGPNQTVNGEGSIEVDRIVIEFKRGQQKVKPGTQVMDLGVTLPRPPFGVEVKDPPRS